MGSPLGTGVVPREHAQYQCERMAPSRRLGNLPLRPGAEWPPPAWLAWRGPYCGPSIMVRTSWGLRTCLPDPQRDGHTAVTSGQLLSRNSDGSSAMASPPAVGTVAVGNSGFSSAAYALSGASAGASECATGSGGGGGWVATHSQGPGLWAAAAGGSRGGGGEGGGVTRWYAVQDKACGTVTHMAPEAMVKGELVKGECAAGAFHPAAAVPAVHSTVSPLKGLACGRSAGARIDASVEVFAFGIVM